MRQVKTKSTQFQRAAGSNRRGKPVSRPPASRSPRQTKSAEAPGAGMVRRILLRRPILVLTLGLVVAGVLVGLFAGGHVAKVILRVQTAIAAPFTDAGFAVHEVTVAGEERTTPESASAALT